MSPLANLLVEQCCQHPNNRRLLLSIRWNKDEQSAPTAL